MIIIIKIIGLEVIKIKLVIKRVNFEVGFQEFHLTNNQWLCQDY